MLKVLKVYSLIFLICFGVNAYAQRTTIYTHPDADFRTGLELFQKEKYSAAQKHFNKIIDLNNDASSLLRIDAEFYKAICAIELFNKDGEYYLKQFIKNHPESNRVRFANFYLGKYNYRKKKYKEALDWFAKVDIYDLTQDELGQFYFERGYSLFSTEQFDAATTDFFELKKTENKYTIPSTYYYAHIAYLKKNYETALVDFIKLKKDATFGPVVGYYIVQLYFLQKQYDSVIALAPALLDTMNSKRAPEIARITGESYYNTSRYKEALPYLKQYKDAIGELSREDYYQLGFAFYKNKEYSDALINFIKANNGDEDELAQNIAYHMGDCYLKTSQKTKAINAFKKASRFSFDTAIEEDALFNYAKLCYETSYNPYNEAIKAFKKYIKKYPGTVRSDEAYTYLVNAYTTTNNYAEAVEAIENIATLTPDLKYAHQKAAYFLGIQKFNNENYSEAITAFDKSGKYIFDKNIKALAIYWKAESYYRSKNFSKAIETYKEYILEPGAIGKPQLGEANYNIGYSYYNLKDYNNSNLWFRKFVVFKPEADPVKINDAQNRIGDGYFMQREFSTASTYYSQAYKMKLIDGDYSLYQKAVTEGLEKKLSEKINDLKMFITEYPHSGYILKAKYELASTYLLNHENDEALASFLNFIDLYPTSIHVNTCLSKIGLIYYNKKEDDKALEYFDKLIQRDRKSPEANEAIALVKAIYKSKGDIAKMESYLTSIGEAIPQASLDTITFEVGKNHFMEQNCNAAVEDLKKYIQKFPDGIFITDAHFYKAECDYSSGKTDDAIESYMFVANKNNPQYAERSLYRITGYLYKKEDYLKASEYYKQLEKIAENSKSQEYSVIGLMRCQYQLKNYAEVIEYSKKVLAIEKVSTELFCEAHYNIGQALLATQKPDEALAEFTAVANSTKNELGAESNYRIAQIQHNNGEYKQAEKTIYDLINSESNSPYWITNSLLLLSDNYVALKDDFQAKTVLNSIISDSDIPELIKVAQDKLNKITSDEAAAAEAAKAEKPKEELIQLKFQGDTLEQKNLFITEPFDDTISE